MRFERYFVEDTFEVGNIVSLENEQAKHCALVMRHSTGDKVIIFNGKGGEFTCEIIDIHKRKVGLKILEFHNIERELNFDIHLFVAAPKQKRFAFLIEKATELGVKSITPMVTKRAVREKDDFSESKRKRYENKIIEACKQCGRNTFSELREPMKIENVFDVEADYRFVLQRYETVLRISDVLEDSKRKDSIAIAVGPEGGFTYDELTVFEENNWKFWDLGNRTLRIETAAIAALSIINNF